MTLIILFKSSSMMLCKLYRVRWRDLWLCRVLFMIYLNDCIMNRGGGWSWRRGWVGEMSLLVLTSRRSKWKMERIRLII